MELSASGWERRLLLTRARRGPNGNEMRREMTSNANIVPVIDSSQWEFRGFAIELFATSECCRGRVQSDSDHHPRFDNPHRLACVHLTYSGNTGMGVRALFPGRLVFGEILARVLV